MFRKLFSNRISKAAGSARCADGTPERGTTAKTGVFIASLALLIVSPARLGVAAVSTDNTNVKVSIRRDHGVSHFFVENSELSEVTMTFVFTTKNLKSTVAFPYTRTFKPGETEAFTLSHDSTNQEWEYSYTNYYKLGSRDAVPDDYVYSLPYTPGSTYKVTQGYNGHSATKDRMNTRLTGKCRKERPCAPRAGGWS